MHDFIVMCEKVKKNISLNHCYVYEFIDKKKRMKRKILLIKYKN
jgi:hypothetical protein